ncbi:MAG: 50S ribosomal protein L11 methyltransferase [Anaerolineae bacterium]|nr:50S ribosomal protein L11 methyltransferase [Anaerolineae bacterium]
MTTWNEVSLQVDGEGAEAVADVLRRYVHQGIAIEQLFPGEAWEDEPRPAGPLVVRGYFPADANTETVKEQIEQALYYMRLLYPIPKPTFKTIEEEDWADAWKQHYHPVRIGLRILIKPAWLEADVRENDIVIEMDPGMAFGTGTHPTTQLCLEACERFIKPGMTVADLGTGSGILAIAAARLGARVVVAVDVDEKAVQVAQENAARNGVSEQIRVSKGSVKELLAAGKQFEIGLANLTAKIIQTVIPDGLEKIVMPGGRFIFSGVIDEQQDEVCSALEQIGLMVSDIQQRGDWLLITTERQTT